MDLHILSSHYRTGQTVELKYEFLSATLAPVIKTLAYAEEKRLNKSDSCDPESSPF
jgi:hypothetical protein